MRRGDTEHDIPLTDLGDDDQQYAIDIPLGDDDQQYGAIPTQLDDDRHYEIIFVQLDDNDELLLEQPDVLTLPKHYPLPQYRDPVQGYIQRLNPLFRFAVNLMDIDVELMVGVGAGLTFGLPFAELVKPGAVAQLLSGCAGAFVNVSFESHLKFRADPDSKLHDHYKLYKESIIKCLYIGLIGMSIPAKSLPMQILRSGVMVTSMIASTAVRVSLINAQKNHLPLWCCVNLQREPGVKDIVHAVIEFSSAFMMMKFYMSLIDAEKYVPLPYAIPSFLVSILVGFANVFANGTNSKVSRVNCSVIYGLSVGALVGITTDFLRNVLTQNSSLTVEILMATSTLFIALVSGAKHYMRNPVPGPLISWQTEQAAEQERAHLMRCYFQGGAGGLYHRVDNPVVIDGEAERVVDLEQQQRVVDLDQQDQVNDLEQRRNTELS